MFKDRLDCSMCLETKSGLLQILTGFVQPIALVPVSTFMFATRHFTYRIPSLTHNRKEIPSFIRRLIAPIKLHLSLIFCCNVLFAMFIAHMERRHFIHLQHAMLQTPPQEDELIGND